MEENCSPYEFDKAPLLIVISGPSSAGKDTILERLKAVGCSFHFVVTATTRPPRPGEVHGVDYFFYSQADFERMIAEGELLEHAIVYGQHKGIPKEQVRRAMESGKDVIMRIDVQGAATIHSLVPEAVMVFLTAASEVELANRLRRRQTEDAEQLQVRLNTVRAEMRRAEEFDYVVVNRDSHPDEAVEQILSIITAEHCRVHPRRVTL